MMSNVTKTYLRWLFACVLIVATGTGVCQDSVDRDGPIFFVGLVGNGPGPENKVLLRWYAVNGEIPFTQFSIYRKPGTPLSSTTYTKISTTGKLRNINLIRSIFERPGEEAILEDIIDVLDGMRDSGVTRDDYAHQLLRILDGTDTCESCSARSSFLVQSNYGVAIVEGLGYLDRVAPATYTYELRTTTGADEDNLLLGRITIDASTITTLPPPSDPEEVEIEGLRGDRKVFLRWDSTTALNAVAPLGFGFNVYRYEGARAAGDTFSSLMAAGLLQKVNRLPLMLGGPTVPERSEDEHYDFMDDNLSFDRIERKGTPFNAGDRLSYWIAARDLLGQNGQPTNPIDVIIQDRQAPPIPQGLTTIEDRVGDDRRIELQWLSNADGDTVAYQLFRYRYYHHVGRAGPPFADDAEYVYTVPEGFIAAVPESVTATVFYQDTGIDVTNDEGRAYWYCVAAIDAAGNRSPLSAPVRGVLYDRQAPDPPSTIELCTYRYNCNVGFRHEGQQPLTGRTDVVFRLRRMDERIVAARVIKRDKGKSEILFDGPFGLDTEKKVTDTVRLDTESVNDDITYFFYFRTSLGEWCEGSELPREILSKLINSKSTQHDILVEAGVTINKICVDALNPDRIPHHPTADGGSTPLEITVTLTDDAVGAVLYRGQECEDFQRITTVRADEGETTVTLVDTLRPGSAAMMCYAVRLYDENQNLSGMTYLEARVVFEGDETVQPDIDSVTALGTASSPEARIKWFGPSEGVSGFRINFATGLIARAGALANLPAVTVANATPVSTLYAIDELSYQDSTSLWSVRFSTLDDAGTVPLETNTSYRIWIEGIDHLGSSIEGRDTYRFTWSEEDTSEERLEWPVRSLPEHTDALPVYTTIPDEDYTVRGIAIQLTDPAHSQSQEVNPLDILVVNTPFVVYRKRTDIADQPYVQISPLIESINTDASGNIQDPFIREYTVAAYYMDYVGIVHGASYRYVVVELDETGELSLVRGPSTDVTVTFE